MPLPSTASARSGPRAVARTVMVPVTSPGTTSDTGPGHGARRVERLAPQVERARGVGAQAAPRDRARVEREHVATQRQVGGAGVVAHALDLAAVELRLHASRCDAALAKPRPSTVARTRPRPRTPGASAARSSIRARTRAW